MTFEEMERMMQLIAQQQARVSEQQVRSDEQQARSDEHLARMSERQARTDEHLAFIAEQNAMASQTLAKLTLDVTALSADVERIKTIVEKNSADIAILTEGSKELRDRQREMIDMIGGVLRLVELQAQRQDRTDAKITALNDALTARLDQLAGIVQQYVTQSRNGDGPNQDGGKR